MRLKLWLTIAQFEEAHGLLDGARMKRVRLPTEILRNLLHDHSALNAALKGDVVNDEPPKRKLKRERL